MSQGEAEAALSTILQPVNSGTGQGPRPVYIFKDLLSRCTCRSSPQLEGSTADQFAADREDPSRGRVWLTPVACDPARGVAGLPRPEGAHPLVECGRASAVVSERDLQARHVGRNHSEQPGVGIEGPQIMPSGSCDATAVGRGGEQVPEHVWAEGEVDRPVAIFEGMRPGEIFALRWKSVAGQVLRVEQRVYKRILNTPKNGKTREGAISDGTGELLQQWSHLVPNTEAEAFVFSSEAGTTPLSPDNLWRRSMKPKAHEDRPGLGDIPDPAQDQRQPVKEGGRRSEGRLGPEGHGIGVSLDVYTSSGHGAEERSGAETRSRCASKTGNPAVSVSSPGLLE